MKENEIEFTDEKGTRCVGVNVEDLAKYMHDEYEKISKELGWNTQDECKVEFKDLPEDNKKVMCQVALSVIYYMNNILA